MDGNRLLPVWSNMLVSTLTLTERLELKIALLPRTELFKEVGTLVLLDDRLLKNDSPEVFGTVSSDEETKVGALVPLVLVSSSAFVDRELELFFTTKEAIGETNEAENTKDVPLVSLEPVVMWPTEKPKDKNELGLPSAVILVAGLLDVDAKPISDILTSTFGDEVIFGKPLLKWEVKVLWDGIVWVDLFTEAPGETVVAEVEFSARGVKVERVIKGTERLTVLS